MPSSKWFNSLGPKRQKAYLKSHPGSKFKGVSAVKSAVPGSKPALGAMSSKPRPMNGGGAKAAMSPEKKAVQTPNGGDTGMDAPRAPKLVPRASSGDKDRAHQAKVKGFGNKIGDAMRAALKGK